MISYKDSFNKISQDKQKTIIDSATIEFAEHGFDSANINSIAQKAGVSVGSLYKYFGNKEELFLTIVHIGVITLKNVLEEIIHSEEGLLERVERILRAIQSHSRNNVHLTRLYNEMTTENRSELVWKMVSDMESATAGLYASLISDAKEKGLVRKDLDAGMFAFFLDNLFIMLQFSYCCEYYKQRMMLFVGDDVFEKDDLLAEQLMKFIKGAFLAGGE